MLEKNRKQLPIGIQTFSKIREGNCYYVDKTAFALQLIQQGSYFFLSRPRRFGKSLFLDTLKELFEGNEPLFNGLAIHDSWDWKTQNPVIRISFGDGVISGKEDLENSLSNWFATTAQDYQHVFITKTLRNRFAELIRTFHEKTGQKVVILIDEYDKPILDCIEQPQIAAEIRDVLLDVFSTIKDSDAHIRFVFITGVSNFPKASMFS